MSHARLNDLAQTIIDSNRYMVLGTADQAGHPLVTAVWFSSEDYTRFRWVSSPGPLSVSPTARRRETDTSETPRTRSGTPRDAATVTRTSRFADRRVPRDRACTSVTLR